MPVRNELLSAIKRLDANTLRFIATVWSRLDVNEPYCLVALQQEFHLNARTLVARLAASASRTDEARQTVVECFGVTTQPAEYLVNFDPSCVFAHNVWSALVVAATRGRPCTVLATRPKESAAVVQIRFRPPHSFQLAADPKTPPMLVAVAKSKPGDDQHLGADDLLLVPGLPQFRKQLISEDRCDFLEVRKLFEAAAVAGRLLRAGIPSQPRV